MAYTLATLARAIVGAHGQLALQRDAGQRLQALLPPDAMTQAITTDVWTDTHRQAVLIAAQALDFWPADAQCIAQAWQRQSVRCGRFDPLLWPSAAQDFELAEPTAGAAFAACPRKLGLYAVLPDALWIERMAHAGVPTLQLRFKSDNPLAVAQEVRAAVRAVQGSGARLFINDHWQAAIDAGAFGVHLGQEDLGCADLEAIRSAGLRLGISSHGYAEMLRAAAVHPSYIALGAVYATTLKRMATPPQGPQRLKMYAKVLHDFPTVAIGGIDLSRLPEVLAADVGSVAVVRALVNAPEPQQMARSFMEKVPSALL